MGGNAGDSIADVGGDGGKIQDFAWVWALFNIRPLRHSLVVHATQVYSTLNPYNLVSSPWHVMCMIYGPSLRKMSPKMCTHLASLPEKPKVAIEMYMQEKSASQE